MGGRRLGGGGARGEGRARSGRRFGREEAGIVQGHDGIEAAEEAAEQGGEGEEEGRQQTVGFRPCDQTIGQAGHGGAEQGNGGLRVHECYIL